MGDTAETVELGVLAERHDGVVEGHPFRRGRLAETDGEVLAREAVGGERRVGARLGRDAAKDVVARVRGGPARRAAVQVLAGDVEEAAVANLEPVIDFGPDLVAIVRAPDVRHARATGCRARRGGKIEVLGLLLEDDVDHAGDGVRPVLRSGAVPQHLDPVDGRRRYRIQVHAHRAPTEGAVDMHQRARVAPLAVHQDEYLVGAEAAQARRVDVVRPVGDGLVGGVERRCQRGEDLIDLGLAVVGDLLRRDHVHWHWCFDGGARGARADDDHLVQRERRRRELEVTGHGLSRRDRHPLLRRVIADEARAHGVGPGRHAQVILPLLVGEDGARGPDDHDAGTRQGCR